jgi:FtsH-binding integral membrane protein
LRKHESGVVRKIWEFLALSVILIIVMGIVSDAVAPYLPIVGMVIASMMVLVVAILLFRLVLARRKFW